MCFRPPTIAQEDVACPQCGHKNPPHIDVCMQCSMQLPDAPLANPVMPPTNITGNIPIVPPAPGSRMQPQVPKVPSIPSKPIASVPPRVPSVPKSSSQSDS